MEDEADLVLGQDPARGSGGAARAAHIVVTRLPTGTTVPDPMTRAPVGSQRSGRAGRARHVGDVQV
ncbi:hypothetical protein, partial [Streptomyces sp. NPDC059564]|uniref:hypothetical protein n=1 Tax=Streptomyces sp. NPDC059564 TaxID=3346865 RepID=UPI0036847FD4